MINKKSVNLNIKISYKFINMGNICSCVKSEKKNDNTDIESKTTDSQNSLSIKEKSPKIVTSSTKKKHLIVDDAFSNRLVLKKYLLP